VQQLNLLTPTPTPEGQYLPELSTWDGQTPSACRGLFYPLLASLHVYKVDYSGLAPRYKGRG